MAFIRIVEIHKSDIFRISQNGHEFVLRIVHKDTITVAYGRA